MNAKPADNVPWLAEAALQSEVEVNRWTRVLDATPRWHLIDRHRFRKQVAYHRFMASAYRKAMVVHSAGAAP